MVDTVKYFFDQFTHFFPSSVIIRELTFPLIFPYPTVQHAEQEQLANHKREDRANLLEREQGRVAGYVQMEAFESII